MTLEARERRSLLVAAIGGLSMTVVIGAWYSEQDGPLPPVGGRVDAATVGRSLEEGDPEAEGGGSPWQLASGEQPPTEIEEEPAGSAEPEEESPAEVVAEGETPPEPMAEPSAEPPAEASAEVGGGEPAPSVEPTAEPSAAPEAEAAPSAVSTSEPSAPEPTVEPAPEPSAVEPPPD